ncbi:MAG TPA: N-6 DNA methylase [Saprospiraceae bacterium]|nr:N-6 DNA methylase [Saprospiraceae bacterium]
MTLKDAIYQTLSEADRPMTASEVTEIINSQGLYIKKDNSPLTASQVRARISQYPQEFDYIQGEIILVQNSSWSDILRSHKYLQDLLRVSSQGDKGTLVVFFLFYKRISDLSELGHEHQLPQQARINYLRNNFAHSMSESHYDDIKYGVIYLQEKFPQLHDFFYQQLKLIREIPSRVIFEVINVLSLFDTSRLEDRKFGRIFEHLVQKSFNISKDGYYFTPQPVAELLGNLVDLEGVTNVFDPCAGLGGLFTEINKETKDSSIHYFATDLNERVSSLGALNLILNGIRDFNYISADCLTDPFNIKFDLIISDLPLISRINDNIDFNFIRELGLPVPTRQSGTATMILYVLNKLTACGKAFLTVPDGFLTKKGYDEITRQFIIDNGLLEAVISLPANALNPYTSVKVSILCLSSRANNLVKFINGARSFSQIEKIGGESTIDDIIKAYKWSHSDTRISTIMPISAIRRNEYILAVDQYNEIYRESGRLLEEGNAQHLDSLAVIKSGTSSKNITEQPEENSRILRDDSRIQIIKAENLKKDILDIKLAPENVKYFVGWDVSIERSILREKCLLIARIGENPKPTIFDPADFDRPICIHRGVYAIVPQTNSQISVEYLYYQFYSPFVQQQLSNSQVGATIPHISISNLYKIVIPVVDLREQNKLVSSQRANLIQLEKEKIEERLKVLGYEKEVADKESDIVRVLVHQLRPTFLSLNSQVESILRIVEKNNLQQFKEFEDEPDFSDPELLAIGIVPNKPTNHTIQELGNKLLKDSKDINDKLTYVNKVMGFNLGKDDFEENGLKEFIQNHINAFFINRQLKFKVEVTGEECIVEFNKESMGELIDQLIHNAQTHAFNESSSSQLIKFQIKRNRQTPIVTIEYSNNGKDFNLTLDQFVSPFQKSQQSNGSGIGGYYIKRIVEAHEGTLLFNEKNKKGFTLIIEIPITQKFSYDE